jgi:hypothetical protein
MTHYIIDLAMKVIDFDIITNLSFQWKIRKISEHTEKLSHTITSEKEKNASWNFFSKFLSIES